MRIDPSRARSGGLAALLVLGGCAAAADHPSLAPRPIEKIMAQPATPEIAPNEPAPAADARIAPLLAAARDGDARFTDQVAATRALAAAAGGAAAGSEAWVQAEQAITRLDALRAPVTKPLAELDALVLAGVRDPSLASANAEVDMIDARESAEVDQIRSRLSGP